MRPSINARSTADVVAWTLHLAGIGIRLLCAPPRSHPTLTEGRSLYV